MWVALAGSAQAWVRGYQPFPNGQATVILHRFCQKQDCGPFTQQQWQQMVQHAVDQWNGAGAHFTFHTRPVQATDNPCQLAPGEVAIILSDYGRECPGDPSEFLNVPDILKAFAAFWPNGGRVYIQAPAEPLSPLWAIEPIIMHYLVHELGHLVGLDHPNEVGQYVDAIMNGHGAGRAETTLQADDIAGIRALYPQASVTYGSLESPAPGATVSGLGFFSGWKCDAAHITVQIDNRPPVAVAMGMPREDTQATCQGEVNNGFIVQTNWNWLEAGTHTAVAYDNGREFARSTFTVGTTGEEFLEDLSVSVDVPNFPAPGETGRFVWNESTQHLELAEVIPAATN